MYLLLFLLGTCFLFFIFSAICKPTYYDRQISDKEQENFLKNRKNT